MIPPEMISNLNEIGRSALLRRLVDMLMVGWVTGIYMRPSPARKLKSVLPEEVEKVSLETSIPRLAYCFSLTKGTC